METTFLKYSIQPQLYRDSVTLMALAASLESNEDVIRAGAVMATPANLSILERSGMLPEGLQAEPNDLLLVVRGVSETAAESALAMALAGLSTKRAGGETTSLEYAPRTVDEGLESDPEAELVTISVPGAFAGAVAEDALNRGLNVFCFSDNVSVKDEDRLKTLASQSGLLMMGPDCGTALLDGTPLGFVNVVPTGPVGIVAASGTGAQEMSVLLAAAGIGTSQIIGVGGRDLSGKISHPATYVALEKLRDDQATKVVVVVSKPPDHKVTEQLVRALSELGMPSVACLVGEKDRDHPVIVRGTIDGAARAVAELCGEKIPTYVPDHAESATRRFVTGLYTGGTLAHEAQILCEESGVPHSILDLGDDQYTQGRPHPMISPELRADMIRQVDESAGVLLVDVVLGYGSSSDPATPVAKAVQDLRNKGVQTPVLASITGTEADPQVRSIQKRILESAGIVVFSSNGAATRFAIEMAEGENNNAR